MSEQEYKAFLKELVQDLERHLIQNSSMTHVIFSLKEMQILIKIEEYWLHKILLSHLSAKDLEALEKIGQKLNDTYKLALSDVIDLIDTAQNYCLTSLPHSSLPISPDKIIASTRRVKQHLGYGFFKSAVDEFVGRFEGDNFMETPAMKLHKNWLKTLRTFLQDIEHNPPPVMEHNLCAFSKWLETLEAKLILHASKSHHFDMQGNILLTHRTVHEEASYVHIHLSQQDYLKALSHFENLCQAFLLLDKYINEANFIYLQNRYFNFIDFVMTEGKHQQQLSYYFVIHYGLIEQAEIRAKQKKIVLESFTDLFLKKLATQKVEHISLLQKDRLHVVIKRNPEDAPGALDANALVYEALEETYDQYSRILSEQLYINHFKISDLTNYQTKHFSALLLKIQKDKQNQHIREVKDDQIQRYQTAVEQDFILLESIKRHLKEKSFELHYQPIVDHAGNIMALESLIRMQLDQVLLEADSFLGIVETYRLTVDIDLLVMDLLYDDLAKVKTVTNQIHINIYPKSLAKPEVINKIIRLAKAANELNLELMIEITEHEILMHDEALKELSQQHKIHFAIDDFGAGYSNLANLVEFASKGVVQIAKLDGKLIENIDSDDVRFRIVHFITDMAENLGLQPVIAEYVDSQNKLDALNSLPSSLLYQGHFFYEALPLENLIKQAAED